MMNAVTGAVTTVLGAIARIIGSAVGKVRGMRGGGNKE